MLEEKAKEFAYKAHEGQLRKDYKTPYITHCVNVVNILKNVGVKNPNLLSAGWLHDTVEDTDTTLEMIEQEFNSEIAYYVKEVTRDCSRDEYKERIKNAVNETKILKLADVTDNCLGLDECLDEDTIRRKVNDCQTLYFDMAKEICPQIYEILVDVIKPLEKDYSI